MKQTASYYTLPMGLVTDIFKCSLTHTHILTVQQGKKEKRRMCKTLKDREGYMRHTHIFTTAVILLEATNNASALFIPYIGYYKSCQPFYFYLLFILKQSE